MSEPTSWWRRNRYGVLALPVVIALAVAANGIRLDDWWWSADLRSATTGQQGEPVDFHQEYDDAVGATTRSLSVRLDDVVELDAVPQSFGDPVPVPEGLRALRVDLSFEADPDQSVYGCRLALRDADGQRYEYSSNIDTIRQAEPSPCHSLEQPGPKPPIFEGQTRGVVAGEERPPTWRTQPVVLVPAEAEITEVLLWWEQPEHLSLEIRD